MKKDETLRVVIRVALLAIIFAVRLVFLGSEKNKPSQAAKRASWHSQQPSYQSQSVTTSWQSDPFGERRGQTTRSPSGSMQNNEAVQLFRDMGFRESTSRAMAEELERDLQRRIRNSTR